MEANVEDFFQKPAYVSFKALSLHFVVFKAANDRGRLAASHEAL